MLALMGGNKTVLSKNEVECYSLKTQKGGAQRCKKFNKGTNA